VHSLPVASALFRPPPTYADLARPRAIVDTTERDGNVLRVAGWMTDPGKGLDAIRLYVNDALAAEAALQESPDVAVAFPGVAGAGRARFACTVELGEASLGEWLRVDAIGVRDGVPLARASTLVAPDLHRPVPPAELMERVSGSTSADGFALVGLMCACDVLDAVERWLGVDRCAALLDWGCGSGRVTVWLERLLGRTSIAGCDVDAAAVDWCASHLEGEFRPIPLEPPTPYEDERFDVVVGISVMTHLSAEAQLAWLAELRRILRPDGLALLSTHGPLAVRVGDSSLERKLRRDGIDDGTPDPALAGVVPHGYYRATFQTVEYSARAWSEHFEVCAHVEGGLTNNQDLVVLRRR
jgi:SAM-dependent methyltransferase